MSEPKTFNKFKGKDNHPYTWRWFLTNGRMKMNINVNDCNKITNEHVMK